MFLYSYIVYRLDARSCIEPWDTNGSGYRGTVNVTVTGLPCQRWTEEEPNDPFYTPHSSPGFGLGDHNYCRNPDGDTVPWCYNGQSTEPSWEYCHVPTCFSGKIASDCRKIILFGRLADFIRTKGQTLI